MIKVLLVILAFFCITGCTVDISKKNNNNKSDKSNEINQVNSLEGQQVEEKIISVGNKSNASTPLSVGQYGLASKYNVILDEYKDVDVSITKIYDNPDEIISKYNMENPDDIVKKEDGYKFVVLEYEVVFFDFETESFGTDVILDLEVTDISNNSFVINGVKQVISVNTLSSDLGVVNGDKGTVKVAFAIPDNTVNYLVKLGTPDHTIAYYKV